MEITYLRDMYIARLSVDHNKLKLCWPQKVKKESEVCEAQVRSALTVIDSDLLSPGQCFRMLPTDKLHKKRHHENTPSSQNAKFPWAVPA